SVWRQGQGGAGSSSFNRRWRMEALNVHPVQNIVRLLISQLTQVTLDFTTWRHNRAGPREQVKGDTIEEIAALAQRLSPQPPDAAIGAAAGDFHDNGLAQQAAGNNRRDNVNVSHVAVQDVERLPVREQVRGQGGGKHDSGQSPQTSRLASERHLIDGYAGA